MKTFKKYIDAENYAKEVSARELKPISIVHFFNEQGKNYRKDRTHSKDFTVMDKKDEWFYGLQHVMCVTNYKTPFEVHSYSPKSGKHVEAFPTSEMAEARVKELKKEGYRKDIYRKDLTEEEYFNNWVKPYERCNAMVEEHRQELMAL